MKTPKLLLCLFSVILLSCSSDDDAGPELTPQELLMGKWYLTGGTNNGSEVTIEDCQTDSFLEFLTLDDLQIEWYESNCATDGLATRTYTFIEATATTSAGLQVNGGGILGITSFEIGKLTETELILMYSGGSTTGSIIWEKE
ncbi:lipocalin family protein [Flagellimonas marina]|uniref:Lipocalin family protein n=1 Tax=Flagellimonas marina TaxID=1775168 RepID=A0ABV8PQE0_9FLAO